jgi:hypothetical protein
MTSQLKDLREPGPIAVAYEGRTRRELTRLAAPMAKVDRPRCVLPIADGRERQDQRKIGPQLRLILFDDPDLIPSLIYNRLRDAALGQERIHRDHPTCQNHLCSDGLDGCDLIGFVVNGALGQGHASLVRQRR